MLIEVSRRFIALLADQYLPPPKLAPEPALRYCLDRLVEFMMNHPGYVRLALVDFATPGGGMDYIKTAAGGSFQENFRGGPLAPMHQRLRAILRAGARAGCFRRVDPSDFYRLTKAALLIRLVFPDDSKLLRRPKPAEQREVQRWLWNLASRYLAPRRK